MTPPNQRLKAMLGAAAILAPTLYASPHGQPRICTNISSCSDMDANCDFIVLEDQFAKMLGLDHTPSFVELLLEDELPIFHEGPVLLDNALYFNSNRISSNASSLVPRALEQCTDMYKLNLTTTTLSSVPTNIPMANGMTLSPDEESILVLSQGFAEDQGSKIYRLNPATLEASVVLEGYHNKPFNSLNDIEATQDNILFFTDPEYGFEQGFRSGRPELGDNVYRYDRNTGDVSVLSTAFRRPNGIALHDTRPTNGHCTLYITETGYDDNDEVDGHNGVYIFQDTTGGCFESTPYGPLQPLVLAKEGIQDGIMIHQASETLLYCDGLGAWFWSLQSLQPIGIAPLKGGGCTQLVAEQQAGVHTLYLLAETKLYSIDLDFGGVPLRGNRATLSLE